MTSYRTTMRQALEEMHQNLNESNLDLMRKAAGGAKQTLKMKDGRIGMDSFTASAIMQIYDKVNDKNRKTMENLLNDGKKADIVKLMKFAMSKVNASYEEFEEEFELDEASKLPPHLAKFFDKDGNLKKDAAARIAKGQQKLNIKDVTPKGYGPSEEADLDENLKQMKKHINDIEFDRKRMTTSGQESLDKLIKAKSIKDARKAFDDMYGYEYDRVTSSGQESMVKVGKMLGMKMEEVELGENVIDKVKEIASKKAAAKIDGVMVDSFTASAISQIYDKVNDVNKKKMEKLKITKLADLAFKMLQKSEFVPEGAAADARRAMRSDPDMKQRAFSKDVSATDDDEKGASKNIMMQLRKAVSLRSYDVEFADGKKQKVDQKIAQAVQNKYNSMRRPADKEKFQAQIAKSYKDMLKTIKSGYGEQKESILEKIERKIKENKNG